MEIIQVEQYQKLIKKERPLFFKTSFDRAYLSFIKLGYHQKDRDYFINHASDVVVKMREQCWADFLVEEELFTSYMLKKLIIPDIIQNMSSDDALKWYLDSYPEHIYQLCLSNTQSRRSRAGKEFEDIIELIFMGTQIPMDSQGNIGKETFEKKGLSKMVDIVSPGVTEFKINKRNTVLVSAKTTLRERWQEVPEEMGRTGAREMFLATLDENISRGVLKTLYEANIQVVTTRFIKEKHHPYNPQVMSFEQLLQIAIDNNYYWSNHSYSVEDLNEAIDTMEIQINKHEEHDFIIDVLTDRINTYIQKKSKTL